LNIYRNLRAYDLVRGKEEEKNGERRENAIYPNCRVQMKDSINRFLLLLKGFVNFYLQKLGK